MKRKYIFKIFSVEEEIELEFNDGLTSNEINEEVDNEFDYWMDNCIENGLNGTWEEIKE